MATSNRSPMTRQDRRQKVLALAFCVSMVGLLASVFLTGGNPLFPGMSSPLLVLFFFLAAAASVIGLAVIRLR
ncbi:hypothetical protein [Paenarthrobacter nitroguajacolicus]|uniref:hypothetical protein n=1 Tax=Paenarthrobacter nitroguajacolicus TaxID=211146 RepID=UPI00248B2608|nr:hypothetical protein [Paenarthrobacter nitroguajacolicus]